MKHQTRQEFVKTKFKETLVSMQMKHITQMETISTYDLISICYGKNIHKKFERLKISFVNLIDL